MSYSGAAKAKEAREMLGRALSALQLDPSVPPEVGPVSASMAQAVGSLFVAETAPHDAAGIAAVRSALGLLGQALAQMQTLPRPVPAVDASMGTLAHAMGMLFPLTTVPEPAAPQVAPPQAAVAPVQQPARPPGMTTQDYGPAPTPTTQRPAVGQPAVMGGAPAASAAARNAATSAFAPTGVAATANTAAASAFAASPAPGPRTTGHAAPAAAPAHAVKAVAAQAAPEPHPLAELMEPPAAPAPKPSRGLLFGEITAPEVSISSASGAIPYAETIPSASATTPDGAGFTAHRSSPSVRPAAPSNPKATLIGGSATMAAHGASVPMSQARAPSPSQNYPAPQPSPAAYANPPVSQPATPQYASPPVAQPAPGSHSTQPAFVAPQPQPAAPSAPQSAYVAPAPQSAYVAPTPQPAYVAPAPKPAPPEPAYAAGQPVDPRGRPEVEVNIGMRTKNNFWVGFDDEVGHGGAFLATYTMMPIGSPVSLLVTLPAGERFVTAARVRFVRELVDGSPTGPGLGFAFESLPLDQRNKARAFTQRRTPLFFDEG